jgi:outer membrane protein assembly factor BamE (lipoprotein component of BamABCDE complex)
MTDARAVCSLILLLAVGCSTPSSRIKKNQELFDSYPPDVQTAIRSGEIRKGFDQNQVYMALGHATKKEAAGTSETWLYAKQVHKQVTTKKDVYKYELERREYDEKVARGERATPPSMEETKYLKRTRVVREVKFTNGRVTSWNDPPDRYLDEWHE